MATSWYAPSLPTGVCPFPTTALSPGAPCSSTLAADIGVEAASAVCFGVLAFFAVALFLELLPSLTLRRSCNAPSLRVTQLFTALLATLINVIIFVDWHGFAGILHPAVSYAAQYASAAASSCLVILFALHTSALTWRLQVLALGAPHGHDSSASLRIAAGWCRVGIVALNAAVFIGRGFASAASPFLILWASVSVIVFMACASFSVVVTFSALKRVRTAIAEREERAATAAAAAAVSTGSGSGSGSGNGGGTVPSPVSTLRSHSRAVTTVVKPALSTVLETDEAEAFEEVERGARAEAAERGPGTEGHSGVETEDFVGVDNDSSSSSRRSSAISTSVGASSITAPPSPSPEMEEAEMGSARRRISVEARAALSEAELERCRRRLTSEARAAGGAAATTATTTTTATTFEGATVAIAIAAPVPSSLPTSGCRCGVSSSSVEGGRCAATQGGESNGSVAPSIWGLSRLHWRLFDLGIVPSASVSPLLELLDDSPPSTLGSNATVVSPSDSAPEHERAPLNASDALLLSAVWRMCIAASFILALAIVTSACIISASVNTVNNPFSGVWSGYEGVVTPNIRGALHQHLLFSLVFYSVFPLPALFVYGQLRWCRSLSCTSRCCASQSVVAPVTGGEKWGGRMSDASTSVTRGSGGGGERPWVPGSERFLAQVKSAATDAATGTATAVGCSARSPFEAVAGIVTEKRTTRRTAWDVHGQEQDAPLPRGLRRTSPRASPSKQAV